MIFIYRIVCSIFLLSIFSISNVKAQSQVANRLIRGSNFQIGVGYLYQHINLDDLNSSIASSNIPEVSENVQSISFLTQNISGNWVATLRTSYSFKNESSYNTRQVEYSNQQYSVGLGYNLAESEKIRLLPSLSATLARNILLIQNKSNPASTFQDLLQNPSQEADLRNNSYLADAGLELHYQFYRRQKERETGKSSTWVPVMLKVGYQFDLGSSNFKFDGDKVSGVPDISLQGLYASLHIGLGTHLLPIK